MIPLIPLLSGLAALFGGGTLVWYYQMGEAQRQEADRIAWERFNKSVGQLTHDEAQEVHSLAGRGRFG
jgi:hypothetical protein